MKTSIKKITHIIEKEAHDEASKDITCHEPGACTPDEIQREASKVRHVYQKRLHEKLNGDGWNMTEVLSIKIGAIPHIYNEHNWGIIKDELVHLKPRSPTNIHAALGDWRTYFEHSEL